MIKKNGTKEGKSKGDKTFHFFVSNLELEGSKATENARRVCFGKCHKSEIVASLMDVYISIFCRICKEEGTKFKLPY